MSRWREFEQDLNKLIQSYENLQRENRMLRKENVALRQQRAQLQQNQQVIKEKIVTLMGQLKQKVSV